MPASFPTSVKTYTALAAGGALPFDVPQSYQDEITAIETFLGAGSGLVSYTPTWVNGTIGNGTLTGKHRKFDKLGYLDIYLSIGSTTTFSAGLVWTFSTPWTLADANGQALAAHILDTPNLFYVAVAAPVSTTTISVYTNAVASGLTSAIPHAWATGDTLRITGWLRVA